MRKAIKLPSSTSTAAINAGSPAKPAPVVVKPAAKPAKPAPVVVKRGKRTVAAGKPGKPAGDNKPGDTPANSLGTATPTKHDMPALSYAGPSPTVRGHGRKLTPIAAPGDKSFGPPTERDNSFLRDIRAAYAIKPFYRLDADAGCVNRQIYYGNIAIVDGELHSRTLRLQITPRGAGLKL